LISFAQRNRNSGVAFLRRPDANSSSRSLPPRQRPWTMTGSKQPIFMLPGAGGGAVDAACFSERGDAPRFVTVGYPGWRRYVEAGFSADRLIELLASDISSRCPHGPVYILGISIGGHLAYAVALRLQAMGREIGGICAVDSFMISSAAPSTGWKGRLLARILDLLRQRRLSDLATFLHSLFWRTLFRLAGDRLPAFLRNYAGSRRLPWFLAWDAKCEEELSMRLLIRLSASWIASLDQAPASLKAPAALLRTERATDGDDAWRRRCPDITIVGIAGNHSTLFDPDKVPLLRAAFLAATGEWRADDDSSTSGMQTAIPARA
jgi:thioesterase domain-containing protein